MKTDKNYSRKILFYPVLLMAAYCLCSCSLVQVKMNPLPPPPPTAKLRVHVVAVTSGNPPVGFWKMSQEKFEATRLAATRMMLSRLGVYEVISPADVKKVLGEQKVAGWQWKNNDWSLAKEVGKTLHADYLLCAERIWDVNLKQDMILMNLHTGRQFSVSSYLPKDLTNNDTAITEMISINYRTLFRDAQSDLLRTALKKGKVVSGEMQPEALAAAVASAEKQPPEKDVAPVKPRGKQPTAEEKQEAFEIEIKAALRADAGRKDLSRLVVYDFDTIEHLKVVGMILTESLREELHKLGGFVLISRENMSQFMEERKLQESGLVNEKQAIKLGEWMAANEAVTGKVAVIGSVSIVQAKRIDLKTLGTIALGSLKCKNGEEDSLLENMPELARLLAQGKSR